MKTRVTAFLQFIRQHKIRILLGLLVLVTELVLYLGTGILLEEQTDFLSGEGSFGETFAEGQNVYCQTFRPAHHTLRTVSFLVDLEDVSGRDGTVTVQIKDRKDHVLYEKQLSYEEVSDGYYTDLDVNLRLSVWKKYQLVVKAEPTADGEYPDIYLCDTSWKLRESKGLSRGSDDRSERMAGVQLVSRYIYDDALPYASLWAVLAVSILTALGIAFGLPENKYIKWGISILLLLLTPILMGWQLEKLTFAEVYALPITKRFRTLEYLPFAMQWNLAIILVTELVILLCSHSIRVSVVLTDILVTLLYSVNYFFIGFRGTPLRMSDFSAVRTAADVIGGYDLTPGGELAIAWGSALLFLVWGVQAAYVKHRRDTKTIASYVATIGVAAVLVMLGGYELLYTDLLENAGFDNDEFKGFYQDMIYYRDGFLVAACIEVKNARMEPLDGYSTAQVEKLLTDAKNRDKVSAEGLTAKEKADLPHVILIMNESFADMRVLADLNLSEENLSFFDSLQENTVRGYVNASVIGGGTANTEFEVFTGCSMAFCPVNYYPYQQAVNKPMHTLISSMQSYGYTAISMHPEVESNWNRTNVYRYFGFDESLWEPDFEGAEVIHAGVSDAETFKRVEELYENRAEGEKLFVFDLTMQNHGDYFGHDAPYEVQETNICNPIVDEYLSLIKESDEAFEDLIHYFENEDEKVIICMYGDHQPWFSDLILNAYYGSASAEPGHLMTKYKTPFVIWANYDIRESEGYDISMNYLGGLLQRTAGIPLTPYFSFLEDLREDYPIITANGYVDAEGTYHNWDGSEKEFPEYRMLQYNYLYDENTLKWGY